MKRPLGPEDLAILELENATIVGHICHVVLLGGAPLARDALTARLAERIGRTPLLTFRLDAPAGGCYWVPDPHFDLQNQVSRLPVAG